MTSVPASAATLHVLHLAAPASARQIMRPVVPEGASRVLAGTAVHFRVDGMFDPDPLRAFVLVLWPDADAAVAYVRAGSAGAWPADATEAWHAALSPYRFRGEVNWVDGPLFARADSVPATATPIVTMTTTAFSDDPVKALALGAAMHEVQADDGAPGGGPDGVPGRLRTAVSLGAKRDDGRTFTLWADEAAALAWAHRTSPHREMLRRQRDEALMPRSSFTRFALLAAGGTWGGRDPLTVAAG